MTTQRSANAWAAVAAVAGFAGVALDAAGAHALGPSPDPSRVHLLELATRYLLIHAGVLVGVAVLLAGAAGRPSPWLRISAGGFTLGMLLFCGGLTVRALTDVGFVAPVVPVGGTALLAGWAALAGHAVRAALHRDSGIS